MKFILLLLSVLVSHPLRSVEAFNTHPFVCAPEVWHSDEFTAAQDMYIRQAELWMGMNRGSVADLGYAVRRKSDNSNILRGNWDHYAEPVGIDNQIHAIDFAPDYFLLTKGDTLTLYYHCLDVSENHGAGHIIVTLWWYP